MGASILQVGAAAHVSIATAAGGDASVADASGEEFLGGVDAGDFGGWADGLGDGTRTCRHRDFGAGGAGCGVGGCRADDSRCVQACGCLGACRSCFNVASSDSARFPAGRVCTPNLCAMPGAFAARREILRSLPRAGSTGGSRGRTAVLSGVRDALFAQCAILRALPQPVAPTVRNGGSKSAGHSGG